MLRAGLRGKNAPFVAAKVFVERAQREIRAHLIHPFKESVKATDHPTEDLRKLGNSWEALCKNADWPQEFVDFIEQDKAEEGALEQAQKAHEEAVAVATAALLQQGIVSPNMPNAKLIQEEGKQKLPEVELGDAADQGEQQQSAAFVQFSREICAGVVFERLPCCFGLTPGSWDDDVGEFGIDSKNITLEDQGDDNVGSNVRRSEFISALMNHLKRDLELTSVEQLLLSSQKTREVEQRIKERIQSQLPEGWRLIQETIQSSIFRGDDGILYQSIAVSNMHCMNPCASSPIPLPLAGECSFVVPLLISETPLIAQWTSNSKLAGWLSGGPLKTKEEVMSLSRQTVAAKKEQEAVTAMPSRWVALSPLDATKAQNEKALLALVEKIANPDITYSNAREAYNQCLRAINQSDSCDQTRSNIEVMLRSRLQTTDRSTVNTPYDQLMSQLDQQPHLKEALPILQEILQTKDSGAYSTQEKKMLVGCALRAVDKQESGARTTARGQLESHQGSLADLVDKLRPAESLPQDDEKVPFRQVLKTEKDSLVLSKRDQRLEEEREDLEEFEAEQQNQTSTGTPPTLGDSFGLLTRKGSPAIFSVDASLKVASDDIDILEEPPKEQDTVHVL